MGELTPPPLTEKLHPASEIGFEVFGLQESRTQHDIVQTKFLVPCLCVGKTFSMDITSLAISTYRVKINGGVAQLLADTR